MFSKSYPVLIAASSDLSEGFNLLRKTHTPLNERKDQYCFSFGVEFAILIP